MLIVAALVVVVLLGAFSEAVLEVNMSATTNWTSLVGWVGEPARLTYNISARVGTVVQCTRNADHVTSYYVLVPGEEAVVLNRSISFSSLMFRDAGLYTCEARVPVPGGNEPPVANVSWTLTVERRPPACLANESCSEAQGHSCWRDLCTCRSSDMGFFSKRGRRRCRLAGALSLTARITALPRSAGRCSCTDNTGKDHGRAVDGQCVASCTQPKDCDSLLHSHCFGGVCQCFDGLHLYNRSCVPNRCSERFRCSVNETCVSGHCFCRPGYMVENGRCVQAECSADPDCIWKNTECFAGRCVCLPGYRVIEGDCDREYFGSCSLGCSSVLNSQCGGGAMCVCSPGYVYRAVGGYESCSPIECHHRLACPVLGARCVDYACVCEDGNVSSSCREGSAPMLSFSEEEPPVHETVLLLCGGAIAFIAVGALPVLVWRHLGPGRKLRRPPAATTGNAGQYLLAWPQHAVPIATAPVMPEPGARAPKRRYPFEAHDM